MIKKFKTFENRTETLSDTFEVFQEALDIFREIYNECLEKAQELGFEILKERVPSKHYGGWSIEIILKNENVQKRDKEGDYEYTLEFKKLLAYVRDWKRSKHIFKGKRRVHCSIDVEYTGEYKGCPYISIYID